MIAALWIAGILATVAAYFAVGVRFAARPYITREVDRHCREYRTLAAQPGRIDEWRRTAATESIALAAAWPLYLTGRAVTASLARSAPPSEYERQRRIADLERDLGIKP